jgi:hypothetical protein
MDRRRIVVDYDNTLGPHGWAEMRTAKVNLDDLAAEKVLGWTRKHELGDWHTLDSKLWDGGSFHPSTNIKDAWVLLENHPDRDGLIDILLEGEELCTLTAKEAARTITLAALDAMGVEYTQ